MRLLLTLIVLILPFNTWAAVVCTASLSSDVSAKAEVPMKQVDANFYWAEINEWDFLVSDFTSLGGPLTGQILLNSDSHEGSDNVIGYLLVGQPSQVIWTTKTSQATISCH